MNNAVVVDTYNREGITKTQASEFLCGGLVWCGGGVVWSNGRTAPPLRVSDRERKEGVGARLTTFGGRGACPPPPREKKLIWSGWENYLHLDQESSIFFASQSKHPQTEEICL